MVNSFIYLNIGESKLKLTITFDALNYLRSFNTHYYLRMMELMNEPKVNVCDVVEVIYIAYLCADYKAPKMTLEEFLNELDKYYDIVDYSYLLSIYADLVLYKKNNGFRDPFEFRTITKKRKSIPKFKLEDLEDYYTYYVLILNISESLFWNADYSFLNSVVKNKQAYDGYVQSEKEKEIKRMNKNR